MTDVLKIKVNNTWVGIPAIKGDPGEDGVGIPEGGTTGQVLAKASNTDYDTEWITKTIPTKTSDLTNDSDFITSSYHDSTKYDASNPNGYITSSYHDSTKYDASNPNGYITSSYHDDTKSNLIYNSFGFAKVGNPTITDDGIASSFSNSNKINGNIFNISNANSWEVVGEFTTSSDVTNQQYLFALQDTDGVYASGISVINSVCKAYVADTNGEILSTSSTTSPINIMANTKYTYKLNFDSTTGYKAYLGLYGQELTLFDSSATTRKLNYGNAETYIGRFSTSNPRHFKGSIDLKQFSITVDGVKVFDGSLEGTQEIENEINSKLDIPTRYVVAKSARSILPSWWTVYSDGWCEQGGFITGTAITNYTVSLIKQYSNTNYTVTIADHVNSNGTGGYSSGIDEKTTTSFLHRGINTATTYGNTFDWRAEGYTN